MKKQLFIGTLALALTAAGIGSASAAPLAPSTDAQVQAAIDSEPVLPLAYINEVLKQKGKKPVALQDVPTKKEVNDALKNVKVDKEHPVKPIDFGNGHSVTLRVEGTTKPVASAQSLIGTEALQAVTAKGSITYSAGGDIFTMSIVDKYTYDNSTYKITSYQTQPTTSYSSGWTWKGSNTRTPYTYKYDATAIDAVGDGKFSHLILGSYGCHIELRFTATGNYYVHDSYFN